LTPTLPALPAEFEPDPDEVLRFVTGIVEATVEFAAAYKPNSAFYEVMGPAGIEVLQAAIASLHAADGSDWRQIAVLYGELVRLTGSPVVELNRAVAVAEAAGPEAGLALVDALELDGYRYLHSTRADLLRRLGRADDARVEYERALSLTEGGPERRFLERRLVELG